MPHASFAVRKHVRSYECDLCAMLCRAALRLRAARKPFVSAAQCGEMSETSGHFFVRKKAPMELL